MEIKMQQKVLKENFRRANCRERVSRAIKLIKPPPHTVKLNSDGSSLLGICGGGGIGRNNKGSIIFIYSIPLRAGTSNMTEILKVPWIIINIINKIQELVEEHGCEIDHCFREANKLVDNLASMTHNFESIHVFNSHNDVLNQVKGLVNMDKWNMHSFRIKK
ncbi:hypothetical protein H5410_045418 [Solanum commersonii]|uniref:RNase H type-1 domain-containing protein n=1 Tax=Solanum commersonii TaxID=4109 RepID=A0A9J5XDM2_SOLCO|nr:hypothetical protein H5410_045418 [Solanum commersonii]